MISYLTGAVRALAWPDVSNIKILLGINLQISFSGIFRVLSSRAFLLGKGAHAVS
jgi:hypothetical protein